MIYKAHRVFKNEVDLTPIITVSADDLETACREIEAELTKNPSRMFYFNQWDSSGRPVSVCMDYDVAPYRLYFAKLTALPLT